MRTIRLLLVGIVAAFLVPSGMAGMAVAGTGKVRPGPSPIRLLSSRPWTIR